MSLKQRGGGGSRLKRRTKISFSSLPGKDCRSVFQEKWFTPEKLNPGSWIELKWDPDTNSIHIALGSQGSRERKWVLEVCDEMRRRDATTVGDFPISPLTVCFQFQAPAGAAPITTHYFKFYFWKGKIKYQSSQGGETVKRNRRRLSFDFIAAFSYRLPRQPARLASNDTTSFPYRFKQ